MKLLKLLPILVALSLVGCASDPSTQIHDSNVAAISAPVQEAQASTATAQQVAEKVYENGAAPKDPQVKYLQLQLTQVQSQLSLAQDLVTQKDADNKAQVKDANQTIGDQKAALAKADKKPKRWLYLSLISLLLSGILIIAAPAIVAATGSAAVVQAIPIVGTLAGTAERVEALIVSLILFGAVAGIGKLLGIL